MCAKQWYAYDFCTPDAQKIFSLSCPLTIFVLSHCDEGEGNIVFESWSRVPSLQGDRTGLGKMYIFD